MSPLFALSFWATALTTLACYAWWSRFRVWTLRQDLFAIRDEAWDAMRARGMLDDPSHRELRESVNAMIRFAPDLTLFTVWRILVTNLTPAKPPLTAVPSEICAFHDRVCVRLVRYLLFESLAGWVLVFVSLVFRLFTLTRAWMTRKVASIFDSPDLRMFAARPRPGYTSPGF